MNVQNIERFVKEIDQDSSLQEQLQLAIEGERLVDKLVELAQQKGYSFTKSEIEEYLLSLADRAQSQSGKAIELSETELESVAGGADLGDFALAGASFLGGPIGGLVCAATGLTKDGVKSTHAKKFGPL